MQIRTWLYPMKQFANLFLGIYIHRAYAPVKMLPSCTECIIHICLSFQELIFAHIHLCICAYWFADLTQWNCQAQSDQPYCEPHVDLKVYDCLEFKLSCINLAICLAIIMSDCSIGRCVLASWRESWNTMLHISDLTTYGLFFSVILHCVPMSLTSFVAFRRLGEAQMSIIMPYVILLMYKPRNDWRGQIEAKNELHPHSWRLLTTLADMNVSRN